MILPLWGLNKLNNHAARQEPFHHCRRPDHLPRVGSVGSSPLAPAHRGQKPALLCCLLGLLRK